ncbi:MAG: apolipoprotein N-acyltransferase, partial [Proteobacteria bacterium]|nr:apolipoprotein N-acyltransferase [Pseudomonadota bacterium]
MNEFFQRHESRLRHAAAILAGLLLAAAFPKLGIAGLAWVAPGLLLFSAIGQPAKIAFRLGWLGGLAFNLAALHWLLFIPVTGFPILGWAALSAYCALYPGLWLWLCWRSAPSQPELRQAVPAEHGRPLPSDEMRTRAFVLPNYGQRTVWALQCAVLWVALETVLGCFLTGFPWLALGVSQHKMVPLIQIASCTGVAGVSLLVVWFAAALAGDMVELLRRPERFNKWAMVCLLPLSVALGVFFFGMFATRSSHPTKQGGTPLTLALVQPSIPQTMIWNPAEKTNRFAKLMQLSELALASKPDVLVWPEAALPELSEENFRAVTNLVVQHQVLMVFGADDYELKPGAPRDSQRPADYNFYNSAFLLSREGKVVSTYRKRRLVIFGEYIPLRDWLPFLKWFTPIESGFATIITSRTFCHDEKSSIEAILTFPAPFEAVLTSLKVSIDGRDLTAIAQGKVTARETYEDALDRGKTAILHEEA